MDDIFQALASTARRKMLAYLSAGELTAGEIAERFNMTKPSISKHLSILEGAGLIKGDKRGQFIHYSLNPDSLINSLHSFVQEVCPVSKPLKEEGRKRQAEKISGKKS